eukprot:gene2768-3442_t
MYGFLHGFITVGLGSAVSASFGFWITRKISLKWFESKIESSSKLMSLRNMVEQHPFKIIILMRLLPIPFGLQNGLCAMTRISYTTFIYSSVIGLLPENFLLSYFGSTIKTITDITNGQGNAFTSYQQTLLIVAIVVGVVITCFGKRVLKLFNNNNTSNLNSTFNTIGNSDDLSVPSSSSSSSIFDNSSISISSSSNIHESTVNNCKKIESSRDIVLVIKSSQTLPNNHNNNSSPFNFNSSSIPTTTISSIPSSSSSSNQPTVKSRK